MPSNRINFAAVLAAYIGGIGKISAGSELQLQTPN